MFESIYLDIEAPKDTISARAREDAVFIHIIENLLACVSTQ